MTTYGNHLNRPDVPTDRAKVPVEVEVSENKEAQKIVDKFLDELSNLPNAKEVFAKLGFIINSGHVSNISNIIKSPNMVKLTDRKDIENLSNNSDVQMLIRELSGLYSTIFRPFIYLIRGMKL